MCTREVLCEAVEAAQLLRVADIATASLMLVVDADERRSLLSDVELGRGLCEAVIVFTAAGLMLTFLDSLFCFAGEVEDEEEEGAAHLALAAGAGVAAAPGRAVEEEPEAPTALRLDVDERPAKTRQSDPLVNPFRSFVRIKHEVGSSKEYFNITTCMYVCRGLCLCQKRKETVLSHKN